MVLLLYNVSKLGEAIQINDYVLEMDIFPMSKYDIIRPTEYKIDDNKLYDMKIMGPFPMYIWILGYNCDELILYIGHDSYKQ